MINTSYCWSTALSILLACSYALSSQLVKTLTLSSGRCRVASLALRFELGRFSEDARSQVFALDRLSLRVTFS
jgi:hypothetical protein